MTYTSKLPKLDKTEWTAVQDYAQTLTGYDPDGSTIKGMKTIEVLKEIQQCVNDEMYAEAGRLIDLLIHREAFTAMVGIEGKDRRKKKMRSSSSAT